MSQRDQTTDWIDLAKRYLAGNAAESGADVIIAALLAEIADLNDYIGVLNDGAAHNAAIDRSEVEYWKERAVRGVCKMAEGINQTTEEDTGFLQDKLAVLARRHQRTYEAMISIENEMDDIRSQLKAAGVKEFCNEC